MVIQSLEALRFRNFQQLQLEFHPRVNLIHGQNGQGKTNLVEALYFLTHLRSFRSPHLAQLIQEGQDQAFLQCRLEKQGVRHRLELGMVKNQKRLSLDGQHLQYSSEFLKEFISLLFAPDLLSLFKAEPQERRNLIDRILLLLEPAYHLWLKDFNQIRRQKNALLRQGDKKNLILWNRLLAEVGPKMLQVRQELVQGINQNLTQVFKRLTGRPEPLTLHLKQNLPAIEGEELIQFLQDKAEAESNKGFMLYGPHQDNFWMTIGSKKDRVSFSQGEYRIAFLSLQLTLAGLLGKRLNLRPVLLLDDLFSELDSKIVAGSMELLSQEEFQVFITSTQLPPGFEGRGRDFLIHQGRWINAS